MNKETPPLVSPAVIWGYKNEAAWLADKQLFVGASEAAAVLGYSKYDGPLSLWKRKHGLAPPVKQSRAMLAGICMEDGIAQFWGATEGHGKGTVLTPQDALSTGVPGWTECSHLMLKDDELGAAATPDRMFRLNDGTLTVLELKHPSTWARSWDAAEPALEYQVQVQQQMTLLQRAGFNVTKGYLVAYFNQADVRTFEIEHDQKLAGQIERALRAYRPHLRDPKLPPKPKGADLTTVEHVEPKPGKVIDIDPMLVDSYLYAQGERKTAEEAERIHRVALEEAIGDAEEVTVRGTAIATWKSSTVNYQPKPASTVTRRTLRFKRNAAQILREAAGRPF